MPKLARVVAVAALLPLLVTAGCSNAPERSRVECNGGGSELASVDVRTGEEVWQTGLTQSSEVPLRVQSGTVLVTGPCGAAVVSLASGDVHDDHATTGQVVGVAGRRLFTRDDSADHGVVIDGTDLDTGRSVLTYSANTQYQAATTARGSLLTFYGDQLEASDQSGSGPSWSLQVPVYRTPELTVAGGLVLVTGGDGSTYAVHLDDGTLAWRTVPPVPATFYDLTLTTVPGTVLTTAGPYGGHAVVVYATDAATGRQRWSRTALGVAAADQDLTVLRTRRAVTAVGTRDGIVRWRHRARSTDPYHLLPGAITPATVVLPGPGAASLGLDRATGRLRWRGPVVWAAVSVGEVVVAETPDRVVGLDSRTGATRWTRPVRRNHVELVRAPGHRVLVLDTPAVPHLVDG